MKKNFFYCIPLSLILLQTACSKNDIDLSGNWQVKLTESHRSDSFFIPKRGLGPTQNIMYSPSILADNAKKEGTIKLPGTLDEGGFGNPVTEPDLGCLSRRFRFIGEATYSRTFSTSETADWRLKLERVLWKSSVKIDGREIGSQESLATPHFFTIKNLNKGTHLIEITVDNTMIHRIGEKGHAYGEHMQTIWNGIIGEIKLTKINSTQLQDVRIHAPYTAEKVEIAFKTPNIQEDYLIILSDAKSGKKIANGLTNLRKEAELTILTLDLKEVEITAWDEFTPQLYVLELYADKQLLHKENIGFRSFKREGNKLFMNGKPLFLRGNLDNCHFPLTGYPSMQKKEWIRIFQISKNNGCNTIRFHSYCPPQAAFEAADEVGLYLAPEAGIWIDGWMPAKVTAVGKGNGDLDFFVQREMNDIVNFYGNHACFAMFGIGNEMGNSDFDTMSKWVEELKKNNMDGFEENNGYKNRLYSICTARAVTAADDYNVTHHAPGIGGMRQHMYPRTNWSYEHLYGQTTIPTIAHEIGQWPIYPDWNEIKKYNGVLRAWNLETLRDHAKQNGVLHLNQQFHFASGMQNKMMYKDEIESFMRTPSCTGIHLLGIQDYSGQGEALIGFLDSFYDKKGFWQEKEVRGCFAPIVTLAEFEKYGWKTSETFTAKLLFRNEKENLKNSRIHYLLTDKSGKELLSGFTTKANSKKGNVTSTGTLSFPLNNLGFNKITLTTTLYNENKEQISESNSWSFWTFDETEDAAVVEQNMTVTNNLKEAIDALNLGKNVLLDASELGQEGHFLKGDWGSVYWSTTWFPGQSNQTLGLWLQKEHPIFKNFSCEGFGDWIWWNICENGRVFNLKNFPSDYIPIAMPVPDFHNNQRLGSLFELAVKRGKILISGYKITGTTIEQTTYRNALINYMKSEGFNPQTRMSTQQLDQLLNPQTKTKFELPEKYKNALLYIACASNNGVDRFYLDSRLTYEKEEFTIENNTWKATQKSKVSIHTPAGELGLLHVTYSGTGNGAIEGRPFSLKKASHATQTLAIDREDCLDGKLILDIKQSGKEQLAIEEIIFIPVEVK